MKSLIQDEIKSYRDEILDFTKALVAIPTENPPGRAYSQCVELIAQELRELGVSSKVVKITSGEFPRYGILGFYGQAKRTLYFHGHYDVVPAANQQQFRPFVRGDRLFGRGSSDMKSGLATMICAIKALRESVLAITGRAPRFEMCPGLLETRFYVERGIPALAYGPGLLKVSHGPNEFVRISDIVRCATIFALTATRMLG